jgi:hypothetical protein
MDNCYSTVRDRIEEELRKLTTLSVLISTCRDPEELGQETLFGLSLLIDDVYNGITEACIPLYRASETTGS